MDREQAQCWFGSCPAWSRVLVDIAILAEVADPCLGGWAGDVSLRWVLAPSLGGWPLSQSGACGRSWLVVEVVVVVVVVVLFHV